MVEVKVSSSEGEVGLKAKKVGITASCSFGIEGWLGQSSETRIVFAPALADADLCANLRAGWNALETEFKTFLDEIEEEDLALIAPLRLEQRITVTILPGAKKPIDAVHGVRYVLAKRVGLTRRKNKALKVLYPFRGKHPVVALHCYLRSRNDRQFQAAQQHSCFGVREATLTRRLEMSGEKGFAAVASDLFDMAQMQDEKITAIRETPKLHKADPEIGMQGDPVSVFRRGWKAIEAWEVTPEEEKEAQRAQEAGRKVSA